jgi:hypothetical protein
MTAEADQDETARWRLVDPWTAEARRLNPPEPLEPDEDWLAGLAGVPPMLDKALYARSRAAAELSDQIVTYQHDTAAVTALALPEPQDNPA